MVGDNIKKIRNFKGIKREELAELSGISWTSIWKIEQGKSDPKVGTLYKLANALDVDITLFFASSLNLS